MDKRREKRGGKEVEEEEEEEVEVEEEEEETSIGHFCHFIIIIIIIIMKDYLNINNTFIVITMIPIIKYVHIIYMRIRITSTNCYMKPALGLGQIRIHKRTRRLPILKID